MEKPYVENSTKYWTVFAKLNFVLAVAAIGISVSLLEVTIVTKGYFVLSSLYLFTTTVVLSKAVRDEDDAKKILNKIEQAKTNKILKEYEE